MSRVCSPTTGFPCKGCFIPERPTSPGLPRVVPRDGNTLEQLAYVNKPDDAVILIWDEPESDGGTPITGAVEQIRNGEFYGV